MQNLKDKIKAKQARIAVIGLGYVGLPLAMEYAAAGFTIVGIDSNSKRVAMVNQGDDYILNQSELLKKLIKTQKLQATTDYTQLKTVDAILICVPTPLNKNREPDISHIEFVTEHVAGHLKKGQLIVLESTTFPGTTDEVILPKLASEKFKVGEDFFLAFSPERMDPGNKDFNLNNTPRIIGGVTEKCTQIAKLLYEQVVPKVHTATSPRAAEMAKLLENIFRNVNISLINELAILCRKMGISIWEVIELAGTKPYGFMTFYPGPGLGGHCIPIDPFYLTWKAREYDFNTRFIEIAGEINYQMPYYVVSLVIEGLSQQKKALNGAKVLLLGVTYKKDIDDMRESPALKVVEILLKKGAKLDYNDPYIPQFEFNGKTFKSKSLDKIADYDAVVITADHSEYDYPKIVKQAQLVIDSRGATRDIKSKKVVAL